MIMVRAFVGGWLLVAVASCGSAATRPDAGTATGGTSGASGTSGTGFAGGSGGAVDAFADPVSDAGGDDLDGPPVVVDAADSGTTLEPIRVTEGKNDASAASYHDLRFVGAGLDQYEGAMVTFRIGSPTGPWRLGSGQARIEMGAFDVLFPAAIAPIYEPKLAHIDADGSGACEVGEPAFDDSGLSQTDLTLTVTTTDVRFRPAVSGWCASVNNWPAPP